jgi:hypothetical protein
LHHSPCPINNRYANRSKDVSAVPRPQGPLKDCNNISTEDQPIVLETSSGVKFKLPVGNGLNPTFWKTINKEYKQTIAYHFDCDTIGQFEEQVLNVGHAMMESDSANMPHTQYDVAIATAL